MANFGPGQTFTPGSGVTNNAPGQYSSPFASQALQILGLRLPSILGGLPIAPESLLRPQVGMGPNALPLASSRMTTGLPGAPTGPSAPLGGPSPSGLPGLAANALQGIPQPQIQPQRGVPGANPIQSTQPVGPIAGPAPEAPIAPSGPPANPTIGFRDPNMAATPNPTTPSGMWSTGNTTQPQMAASDPLAGLAALLGRMGFGGQRVGG